MRAVHAPLSIETITVDPPRAGEVLLRMVAAGICGSDRHILEGVYPTPLPAVVGHEGAGVVEAVGPGVTHVSPGDHVIQTFIGPCGECVHCRRGQRTFCERRLPADGTLLDGTFRLHAADGSPIASTLRLGTFSHYTVTAAANVVAIPSDVDMACAALVSCGVSTGVGAALNVARVQPGDAVVVVGVGGVGVAAMQGAVIGGAGQLIAIDIAESKRDFALAFGATRFVNGATEDALAAILDATRGRGADKVLLTVDNVRPELFRMAVDASAPGATVVAVGTVDWSAEVIPVPPVELVRKQVSLTGTTYGGMDPGRDALRWLELHRAGRLPLERFITRRYPLEAINDAFADLAAGRNIRGVIRFDG